MQNKSNRAGQMDFALVIGCACAYVASIVLLGVLA